MAERDFLGGNSGFKYPGSDIEGDEARKKRKSEADTQISDMREQKKKKGQSIWDQGGRPDMNDDQE